MGETGVPTSVRGFIASHIVSVAQLEVLLLLRAAADKQWTATEVARALVTQPEAAAGWLEDLRRRGLASESDGRYRYTPANDELDQIVDDLAATDMDLSLWQAIPALAGVLALVFGLLWEESRP